MIKNTIAVIIDAKELLNRPTIDKKRIHVYLNAAIESLEMYTTKKAELKKDIEALQEKHKPEEGHYNCGISYINYG